MRKLMMIGYVAVVATSATLSVQGDIICSGDSAAMRVNMPVPTTVNKSLKKIYASPWAGAGERVSVSVDGTCLFSTTNQTETQWTWQPQGCFLGFLFTPSKGYDIIVPFSP